MTKSSKERQQEYRDRQRLKKIDQRIDLWISSQAYSALERLTTHFNATKRDVIERLVINLDTHVTATTSLYEGH